ncbi:IS30 family transposase [Pediococcus acidilactici]|nr:IS30 family transposase [Pediococcus acidilactici]
MSSITYSERIKIETFCELGLSNIQMGVRLNRSPSTISYELSRCQPYQAELAQTDAEYKRSRCGRKTKLSDELKQKILNHLRLSWSPGMIAHEFKLATKSIYNWLNQGRIGFSLNDLPEHGVRQRRNVDQRSKYNQSLGRSIEQRPMMINQRKRIGDFELDTVVGPRGHSKAVLLTLIDRKSRFLWAYRLKDRTTATVNEALTKFLTTFNGPVHSFTVDRGTEFSGLVSLESQYGIKTYYCHAYTPAERGSNERFNRNLRYFYPKGTRFEHISAQDLTTTLLQINQRPLKILDWQTKSRFLWAYRLKDRTTATVNEALTKFLTTFNGPVYSFTVDRGTEFSGLASLESQYGIKTYYCHAYTPAERGSNERFNRNLRYFYPKGTRFEHISAQDLTTTLLQINQRPLKILDWQTPYQVMLTNLSKNSD